MARDTSKPACRRPCPLRTLYTSHSFAGRNTPGLAGLAFRQSSPYSLSASSRDFRPCVGVIVVLSDVRDADGAQQIAALLQKHDRTQLTPSSLITHIVSGTLYASVSRTPQNAGFNDGMGSVQRGLVAP